MVRKIIFICYYQERQLVKIKTYPIPSVKYASELFSDLKIILDHDCKISDLWSDEYVYTLKNSYCAAKITLLESIFFTL